MRLEVHRRLHHICDETGKEYGKLVQKLLAIAFLNAGAQHVIERSIQGIDLEVTFNGVRLAFEVKTTEDGSARLVKKDLEGLLARSQEGAETYLAVLGTRLLDGWYFARFYPGEFTDQKYSLTHIRPYRNTTLEQAISEPFATAVLEHASVALRGQTALNKVLETYNAYRRA